MQRLSLIHIYVLRQQGDIPSRKFIAETITMRELPTAQPVPVLRMADVELTRVDWLWFPYIPFRKLTIIQGNPGEGKTYFAMRLAAACTNRKPLPLSLIHIFVGGLVYVELSLHFDGFSDVVIWEGDHAVDLGIDHDATAVSYTHLDVYKRQGLR